MKLEDEYYLGNYELRLYADAAMIVKALKEERDLVIESLYDDISPTMTGVDYDSGRMFVLSTYTDSMALKIIDTKEKYKKLIEKEESKARLFEIGMDTLTEREREVVRVYYFGHANNLGLSDSYFSEVLQAAKNKLSSFLSQGKKEHVESIKSKYKEEIRQRVQASGF